MELHLRPEQLSTPQPAPGPARRGVLVKPDRPVLALWLEEGGEPTEHLLNELLERRQLLETLSIQTLFLLRGRDSLSHPTLAKALAQLPRVQVLLDDWAYDLEAVARHLGRDPEAPPLSVVCDGAGRAFYSGCGYRAGAAELLLKVAARLCGQRNGSFPSSASF